MIIEELLSLGTFSVDQEISPNQVDQELDLRNAMTGLTTSMSIFATSCPLMRMSCFISLRDRSHSGMTLNSFPAI